MAFGGKHCTMETHKCAVCKGKPSINLYKFSDNIIFPKKFLLNCVKKAIYDIRWWGLVKKIIRPEAVHIKS
jgi:hypothetical protein